MTARLSIGVRFENLSREQVRNYRLARRMGATREMAHALLLASWATDLRAYPKSRRVQAQQVQVGFRGIMGDGTVARRVPRS